MHRFFILLFSKVGFAFASPNHPNFNDRLFILYFDHIVALLGCSTALSQIKLIIPKEFPKGDSGVDSEVKRLTRPNMIPAFTQRGTHQTIRSQF